MKETTIDRIRRFNRFYLPAFDLLGNSYLGSEYSATEARVLFEVFTNDGCNAATIAKIMNIDKSYLSRVICAHVKKGYLYRITSKSDSRAYELHLTQEGEKRVKDFINKSNEQISKKIQKLSMRDCERLEKAFDTITELLEDKNENSII